MTGISLSVNGRRIGATVEPRTTLADFLRDEVGLSGTHIGCEHGACGACTVSVDGASVRACLMLAIEADGASVTTIEAVGGDQLHPLQSAFVRAHALQCGFCTPGMIMTGLEMLQERIAADENIVRDRMRGNLCRCTGYQNIVDAIVAALADEAK